MRSFTLAVLAVSMAAILSGCALFGGRSDGEGISLAGRTVQAEQIYTSTLQVLTTAVSGGVISKETARDQIEPMRAAAAMALDTMKAISINAAMQRREPTPDEAARFEAEEREFRQALDPLLARRFQIERRE